MKVKMELVDDEDNTVAESEVYVKDDGSFEIDTVESVMEDLVRQGPKIKRAIEAIDKLVAAWEELQNAMYRISYTTREKLLREHTGWCDSAREMLLNNM